MKRKPPVSLERVQRRRELLAKRAARDEGLEWRRQFRAWAAFLTWWTGVPLNLSFP